MRVLLQTYAYRPFWGGVQRSVQALQRQLTRRGATVRLATSSRVVLTSEDRHWLWAPFGADGVRRFPFLRQARPVHRLTFLPYLAFLLWFRPRVVHLHFVNVDALYALWARKLLGFRLITTCHGSDVHVAGARPGPRRELLLRTLRASDRVTAVSRELAGHLARIAPEVGVDVVPNGVGVRDLPTRREPVVLFAGRLCEQKDPLLLLEAFAEPGLPPWRLVLAGDGELLPRLRKRVAELGLQKRVHLLGAQSHQTVLEWMDRAAVVVVPSRRGEGCPHVALEAMAAGAPVVAARVGGLPELVEDAGLLFEAGDRAALADCLRRLACDPQLSDSLSRAGLERVRRHHDEEQLVETYLELYRR